jgi:2,3-dihydroxybenzoate decarboxylase
LGKAAPAALALPAVIGAGANNEASGSSPSASAAQGKTITKMKRIALEEHWNSGGGGATTQGSGSWMTETRSPNSPERMRQIADLAELRLADMDAAGITMQVVSGVGASQTFTDAAAAVNRAKKINDRLAELIGKHPDRFAAFAALPTQDPKAAADELERAVRQLGFKGTMIGGQTNWEYLDAQKYLVLWERAADLEVPIYLHPGDPAPEIMKMYDGRPILLGNTWAWGVETATHALRIVCSGIFDTYPKAKLILGHMGESIPYLLARFDEGYSYVAPKYKTLKKGSVSAYIKENILVTTSGYYQPETLVCAVSAMGADHVLFSVDYPYVDNRVAVEMFEKAKLTEADREKIYHLNAEKWLKL